MTELGHPIVGDHTYGNTRSLGRLRGLPSELREQLTAFPRQALHAIVIGFHHPATGKYLEFTSMLPHDMYDLVVLLDRT
jgi:23S rRNA pseudouridine1911/1915/1917 synthase